MQNNDKFNVFVNGFAELSEAVQKLAFKAGWKWGGGQTTVLYTNYKYLTCHPATRTIYYGRNADFGDVLDARTSFEEIAQRFANTPVDLYARVRKAQANGQYVISRCGDIILDRHELARAMKRQPSACSFNCAPESYYVIGEDTAPLPVSASAYDGYELTGEFRKPLKDEYFLTSCGENVYHYTNEFHAPTHQFNGKRWICKKLTPAYVPHTRETAKVGVEVWDTESQAKALVVTAAPDLVRIGATLYAYSEAFTRFRMADKVTPYGVKQ